MTRYGRSPWVDQFPKSRLPSYSPHRGPLQTDVVIVGGGLTGCATAYLLAAADIKVVLLEEGRIGQGSSGSSIGWIADEPGVGFVEIEKALGRRAARHVWQSWRRAALEFGSLLRRLNVKCHLEPQPTLTLASTPEETVRLKREQKARRQAGLDAPVVNARTIASEVAITASAALRGRDSATLDPFRAALGLAAAAAGRGVRFFERSPARRIKFSRRTVDVYSAGGVIRAKRVVVATGRPTPLFKALERHFWFRSAFLALTEPVPAKIRRQLGRHSTIVRDLATPAHIVRWVDDERLLVTGADGETPADRLREKAIVQRTGQLMYELSTMYPDISGILPAYGWDAAYARTSDGLPFIGPHRNYPHHLFAFGDSSHSVTSAYLAARIFLRHVLDKVDPADEEIGFNRYGNVR